MENHLYMYLFEMMIEILYYPAVCEKSISFVYVVFVFLSLIVIMIRLFVYLFV